MPFGDRSVCGFYTTRGVRAESENDAVGLVQEGLRKELAAYSGDFDGLEMSAESVFPFKRLKFFAKHPKGFTFWSRHGEGDA